MESERAHKLIYFPVKALGEPIRFLLNYGGIDFEDLRLDRENWLQYKEKTPFGQVPVLQLPNNQIAHQSVAICRYLGNVVGLVGESPEENLQIDSIVDTISEFRSRISIYNQLSNDDAKKTVMRLELISNVIPFYLSRFEKIAAGGHLALEKLTWADIYFVGLLDYCNGVMQIDVLEEYPNLKQLKQLVLEIPSIQNWISVRPESDY